MRSRLTGHRDTSLRYLKCLVEAVVVLKCRRTDNKSIIGRYMKTSDPQLTRLEYQFVISLLPDYAVPTLDGIRLILENFGKEYPDAPRRDPKEFVDGSFIDRLKQERFVEGLK